MPAEILERMDCVSMSVPRRFLSGVRVQVEPSPLWLRLPSDDGDITDGSFWG